MKIYICFILISCLMMFTLNISFGNSDINVTEPQNTITKYRLDKVKFNIFTSVCEVIYRKGYIVGENFVSTNQNVKILFTDDEFNQLITAINNGSDIKTTITNAVKIKLGIE